MTGLFSDSDPNPQPRIDTEPPRCTALAFLVAFASSKLQTYSPGSFTVDPNKVAPVAGSGGYSVVEIRQTRGHQVVALKQPRASFVRSGDETAFQRHFEDLTTELRILTHTRLRDHPNIVEVLGIFLYESFGSPHLSLVVEYASFGSLAVVLKNENQQVPILTRADLAIQAGRGLQAVHSLQVCHGDVKIENVLVFATEDAWVAKLCDFGQSRVAIEGDPTGRVRAPLGTRLLTAPEIRNVNPTTKIGIDDAIRTDIFSFGLLLWEALNNGQRYFNLDWLSADVPPNIEDMERFLCNLAPNDLLLRGKEFINTAALQTTVRETLLNILERSLQDVPSDRKSMADLVEIWKGGISEFGISNKDIPESYQSDDTICAWTMRHTLYQVLEEGQENYFVPELVPYSIQEKIVEEVKSMATSEAISAETRAYAAMTLSECYTIGFGYERDTPKVVEWLRTAAMNGLTKASLWYPRVCKATGVEQLQDSEISRSQALEGKLSSVSTEHYLSHRVRQFNKGAIFLLKNSVEKNSTMSRLSLPEEAGFTASIAVLNETTVDLAGPLHLLALFGEDAMMKKLLETTPVDIKSEQGFNAAHYACIGGNPATLRILTDAGINLCQSGLHGITPLHLSIFFSQENMGAAVALLLDNGAATDIKTSEIKWDAHDIVISGTPLEWAVHTRNRDLVQLLLPDSEAQDALHLAFHRFYWDLAEQLLTKASKSHDMLGESVFVPAVSRPFRHWIAHGVDGESAIQRTIKICHEHGFLDYEIYGTSVLALAINTARVEDDFHVLQAILSVTEPSNVKKTTEEEPWPPLAHAIARSKNNSIWKKTLEALLGYYTVEELESDFSNGSTYLHLAVRHNSTVAITALLEKGVNVDVKSLDFFQNTPLQTCMSTTGRKETYTLLVKAGASLEVRDLLTGLTPLATMLMGTSQAKMVELSLEASYDDAFYIRVLHGLLNPNLALYGERHRESQDAFECLLIQRRMTKYINEPDESGLTMIQKAAIEMHPRNISILLDVNANIAIPVDVDGLQLLPLQIACEVGKQQWEANKDDPICQRIRENSLNVAADLLSVHTARGDETFLRINRLHLARYMRIPQHEVQRLIPTGNLHDLEVKGKWPGLDGEVTPNELMEADLSHYEAAIRTIVERFAWSLGSYLGEGLDGLEDLVIDDVAELDTLQQPDAQDLTNDAKVTAATDGQALESNDPLPDQEIPDRRDAEAKHAFQAALVKSQETELESLLNDQFDEIAQDDFQWLSDLRDTGMGPKDIAGILLQAFDGSPWVTVPHWVRAVLSESGQDLARQVPVGFHQTSCAHKLCTTELQGLPTFGSLAFDDKHETTVEKVAWLSGLAGALPPGLEPPTHNGTSIVAFSKSAADVIHELQSIVVAQEGVALCLRAIRRIQACAIELQNNGLCCDRYTILALPLNNEDPEVLISTAAMRTITFESLNELATALAQFAESGEDKDHAHIRTRCHSLLSGVFACGGDEFDFAPNELHAFALVVQLLSLSLVLYCRSHVGEFYPPFLKEPLSRITLRGCSNEGPYIVAQPYRLACMAPMLQDDVFAFSLHQSVANGARSLRPGLYITGTCESIVDTWGPASVVAEIGSPVGEKLHGLRIGGGVIAPSDNGLFHWTSSLSFTPDTRSFSYWEPITVGAPSINNACRLDEEESHRLSAPCLTTCGTEASQWIADERQILIQGGQYIQLSVGNIYHKVPKKTLKALLLDTWATLQDVRIFNYFFGVQVSLCTGVARRVPLRALIEDPLLHFVDTLRIEGWTALKPSARKAFAGEIDYDEWICSLSDKQHKCIREVCGKLLELLKNTGFDRKGMMRVLWPSKTNPYLCAKAIPEKAQVWCRILRDSEWCATFVVATRQCLETAKQRCQKKRAVPWHGGGTIFATAVCPNLSIAAVPRWMPLGNWGLEDGGSYWIGQPGADTWVSVRKPSTGSAELFVRQNLFPRSVARWIWQDRVLRERSDSSFKAEDVFVQYIPQTER